MPAGGFGHSRALFVCAYLRMRSGRSNADSMGMSTEVQGPQLENATSAIASLMAQGEVPAVVPRAATARHDGKFRKLLFIDMRKAHLNPKCEEDVYIDLPSNENKEKFSQKYVKNFD